jgi:uncharacterized membrane protein HdeD (DUF308 family)
MKKILLALGMFLLPVLTFAQTVDTEVNQLGDIFGIINRAISAAVPIVISLAILVFIWGVLRYVISTDEDKRKDGKNLMLWGIVGIFVMVSVWGLVGILQKTIGVDSGDAPQTPKVPSTSQ